MDAEFEVPENSYEEEIGDEGWANTYENCRKGLCPEHGNGLARDRFWDWFSRGNAWDCVFHAV
ncbi:unnamed protein product [Orchesella dallaii]|uniref:Uncharacterized protein n=1 Tax=Orchesella dallaii TaxID=48710 RepID=A0ABP1PLP1_9HEXA